ncbi:MAG: 4-hydroxy-tetrahydrodipicolinate reductase [Proteobacteria bacterium]|nr:4-hydroxy-tetrahydrodipicolinate reductase [Pseudomonadota bacterium]
MSVNSPVRVAILGAAGRMGQIIARLCSASPHFEIVARIDIISHEDNIQPPITRDLSAAPPFDILIDFSTPTATASALPVIRERKAAWLVATTALPQELRQNILDLSAQVPIFVAANTSLGIALMQRLCAQAAAMLIDWDCEILETHHHSKVDAPSGTALAIANTIADVHRQNGRNPEILTDRSALHEKRNPQSIGIASLRGGTVAGEHSAIWFGENERLEIKHTAENREIFAHGALKIAKWLARQPAGNYNMNQLLDDMLG